MIKTLQSLGNFIGITIYYPHLSSEKSYSNYMVVPIAVHNISITEKGKVTFNAFTSHEPVHLNISSIFFTAHDAARECLRLNKELIEDNINELKKKLSVLDKLEKEYK